MSMRTSYTSSISSSNDAPKAPELSTQPRTMLQDIAAMIGCSEQAVKNRLKNLNTHTWVVNAFKECLLMTTYTDKSGSTKSLIFDDLSMVGAHLLRAQGQLAYPYNSSIPQYFYAHHHIRLRFPFHPCIIYKEADGCVQHYPLELVRFMGIPGLESNKSLVLEPITPATDSHTTPPVSPYASVSITNGAGDPAFPVNPDVAVHRMMNNAIADAIKESKSRAKSFPATVVVGIPNDAQRFVMWSQSAGPSQLWNSQIIWLKEAEGTFEDSEQTFV